MTIQFLTGTDSRMFGHVFILLQSFAELEASGAIAVCDFGLSAPQRRFLEARGQLAEVPALRGKRIHPWYAKASLVDFLPRAAEVAVWVDADMVMIQDPRTLVAALVAEMAKERQTLAACVDDPRIDIARFIQKIEQIGGDVRPFRALLAQWRIPPKRPYLNSGLFVAASRRWLEDWKKTTFEVEEHMLWEQNAFNVTAWRNAAAVRLLDRRQWNVHGDALAQIERAGDRLLCDGEAVVALHATSEGERHIATEMHPWSLAGRPQTSRLRFFRDEALRALQA
ncbi:MAG TPA: hypothetical protein VE397_18630, partial [Stellaceae bacterium]|nr:hypothetical protein [Stellaceae bacterium]